MEICIMRRKAGSNVVSEWKGSDCIMRIRTHYLEGKKVDGDTLSATPLKSRRIEEIYLSVKRRVEE